MYWVQKFSHDLLIPKFKDVSLACVPGSLQVRDESEDDMQRKLSTLEMNY